MRGRNAVGFMEMAALAAALAALACASNGSRDDSAGYQGMSRDTTVRDTTVIRDTLMVRDTAATRAGDSIPVQGGDTGAARPAADTTADSSAARPTMPARSPQR